jgi:hypothetical protein
MPIATASAMNPAKAVAAGVLDDDAELRVLPDAMR